MAAAGGAKLVPNLREPATWLPSQRRTD